MSEAGEVAGEVAGNEVEDWDLIVVGAGPAGSSAALAALAHSPRLRVLLLDRADFPRDKCCGDGIAPHVFDLLESVGAGDVAVGWTPLSRLDLCHGDSTVEGALSRPVFVIPRETFDARLVERAVDAGAVLRRHRLRELRADPDGLVVDGRFRARVVVGADGAYSQVRAAIGAPPTARRAVAIRGYVPTPPDRRGLQVIRYGDRRQPAYAWSFDRGDGLANVGYGELVDDAGAGKASRAVLLEQLEELLPGCTGHDTAWTGHHLPLSTWRLELPNGPVLLTGDAAGLVNPMTGEGIYYAVATGVSAGRAAARALARHEPGRAGADHRRTVRRVLGQHLQHTWAAARMSRAPAVVDAGIRAAQQHPGVFDDLVEIGLGNGRFTPRLVTGLATALTHPR